MLQIIVNFFLSLRLLPSTDYDNLLFHDIQFRFKAQFGVTFINHKSEYDRLTKT